MDRLSTTTLTAPPPHLRARAAKPVARFGGGGLEAEAATAMDGTTRRVAKLMDAVAGNRTRAMIVEDFFGMGLLRTTVDASRGLMGGMGRISWLAGFDRILREGFSILTDNVMSGLVAAEIGRRHKVPHYANAFPARPITQFFATELSELAPSLKQAAVSDEVARERFHQGVADSLANTNRRFLMPEVRHTLLGAIQRTGAPDFHPREALTEAAKVARILGDASWNVHLRQPDGRLVTQPLSEVFRELHQFQSHLVNQRDTLRRTYPHLTSWGEHALQLLENTLKVKDRQLLGIIAGMSASFATPALINSFINRVWHVRGYPAENALKVQHPSAFMGLPGLPAPPPGQPGAPTPPVFNHVAPIAATLPSARLAQLTASPPLTPSPVKAVGPAPPGPSSSGTYRTNGISGRFSDASGVMESSLPSAELEEKYSQSWPIRLLQQGNWGTALKLSPLFALPLLPASGVFNTETLRFHLPAGLVKRAPARMAAMVAPYTRQYLKESYDFGRFFPFTTQQQMAGGAALLYFSRMLNARTPNEFRERAIDSYTGWMFWILGTPLLKRRVYAPLADKFLGSQLIHQGRLRTQEEVQHLIQDPLLRAKTLKAGVWVSFTAMMTNLALMGVGEPLLAALWTKKNLERDRSSVSPVG